MGKARTDSAVRVPTGKDLRHHALVKAEDPREALRAFGAGPFAATPRAKDLFESLLGHVERIGAPGPDGFRVELRRGRVLDWGEPLMGVPSLWLYGDEHAFDHLLYFGPDAGPPEGDARLDGSRFEDSDITWFLQEVPSARYWFLTADEPQVAHSIADGATAISERALHGTLAEFVLSRVVELLEKD